MATPFKLNQPLPLTRGVDGKFQSLPSRTLANPLVVEDNGGTPATWAPGIEQNKLPMHDPVNRFPQVVSKSTMKLR